MTCRVLAGAVCNATSVINCRKLEAAFGNGGRLFYSREFSNGRRRIRACLGAPFPLAGHKRKSKLAGEKPANPKRGRSSNQFRVAADARRLQPDNLFRKFGQSPNLARSADCPRSA